MKRAPGTAFVVAVQNGNAYLVTSAHVVEGDPSPQVEFVAESERPYRATVNLIEPEERGLALLVVNHAPSGARPIPESAQPVALGASVSVAGFPASLNRFSLVDTAVATVGGRDLFLSRETDEGFSGGPVLVGGAVVGIVYGRESGFGKALGASSIKPFIEGNNLSWGEAGATNPPGNIPVQSRENPKDGLTYVWIPPGTFTMGCSPGDRECREDEKPAHEVTITKGFWMGQTPVTEEAYQRVTGTDPNLKGSRLPVIEKTWDDAKGYCQAVRMRLPTEAEWEYAARAGNTSARYGPLNAVAWNPSNNPRTTHEVGQKQPNTFQLYDMLGSVWEWVADWYGSKYCVHSPVTDPAGPPSGGWRVLRGGWVGDPRNARVSSRNVNEPAGRNYGIGFRCAGDLR